MLNDDARLQQTINRVGMICVAPFPPPVTGMALVSEEAFRLLARYTNAIQINLSKNSFEQGKLRIARMLALYRIFREVLKARKGRTLAYLTVSQSLGGNLKDLIILFLLKRKRIVIHLHGGGVKSMLFDKYPIIKLANRLMCRNIERCLVLGESLRRQYDGVLHPSKIDVLPNFADSALFMTEAEIEAKFASNGPLQVLYLSNLLPGKGYKELTLALKCLEESGYEGKVEAVFAGAFENDAIRDEFLGLIEGSRVIRYAGVVSGEAKKRSLQESHVFCLPSYYKFLEGQPLSILEAYAAGCAVLSTDHGGIKDIFGARNGVVVQKESVDSLVEALKGFISDRRRAREYALFNNSTARTKYSVESFERNLVNAFNLDKGSVLENPL